VWEKESEGPKVFLSKDSLLVKGQGRETQGGPGHFELLLTRLEGSS